eukprot:5150235-Amphidinium_carterae.2
MNISAAVAVTTGGTTGSLPDATTTAQTSAVSHTEAATTQTPLSTAPETAQVVHATAEDQEQSSSYLQQALSKRAHSGSSCEVNPSPRVHMQHQGEPPADHEMGNDVGESTAEPTADDESTKRLKVEESIEDKPD